MSRDPEPPLSRTVTAETLERAIAESPVARTTWQDCRENIAAILRSLPVGDDAPSLTPAERFAANAILDRSYADPDDDPAIVARAALRVAPR